MFKKIKEKLKVYAVEIRRLKSTRKLKNRGKRNLSDIQLDINKLKYEFRHLHIAYCELRGRKREQIEKPSIYNTPNQRYIDSLKKEFISTLPTGLFQVRSTV